MEHKQYAISVNLLTVWTLKQINAHSSATIITTLLNYEVNKRVTGDYWDTSGDSTYSLVILLCCIYLTYIDRYERRLIY